MGVLIEILKNNSMDFLQPRVDDMYSLFMDHITFLKDEVLYFQKSSKQFHWATYSVFVTTGLPNFDLNSPYNINFSGT